MAFWDDEKSVEDSQPRQLVQLQVGSSATYYRYATGASNVSYGGNTYTAEPGLTVGNITAEGNVLENELIINVDWSNVFARVYIAAPPEGIVHVTVYREQGSNYVTEWSGGSVAGVVFKSKRRCEIRCSPIETDMNQAGLVARYGRMCTVPLFSSQCGLTEATYTVSDTVDSVSGYTVTDTQFGTKADGWFVGGKFTARGYSRKIEAHSGNTITLLSTIPNLAAADSYDATAGCDHLFATCSGAKFGDNSATFRGQPHIPDLNPYSEQQENPVF